MLLKATRTDHRENSKEVTEYDEKTGKTKIEEFWRNDTLEIRLYYIYSGKMNNNISN